MALILIVEDDDLLASVMRRALAPDGHEVHLAEDGKKAWAFLLKAKVDLLVTDILMPEKDGLELIPQVRKNFPATKILAISGGGQLGPKSYLGTAKALGAHETLLKPFSLPDFIAMIIQLLGNHLQDSRLTPS